MSEKSWIYRLHNQVMEYAWGSRTAISEFLDAPVPAAGPQAELWMGAHPKAPSIVQDGAHKHSLLARIESAPEEMLGRECAGRFENRLPFLFKVLAAARPLSIQAHPSAEQAKLGFSRENALGIALDAPHRSYRDSSHKPELLCALAPFDALCGFRPPEEILRIFRALELPALEDAVAALGRKPDAGGVRDFFAAILRLPLEARREGVAFVLERLEPAGPFAEEAKLARALNEAFPDDVGVIAGLCLHRMHLEPGEAVYLTAGNLHAYLGGVGLEIMANSDNVLRGGLTEKHIDVDELLSVVDFDARPVDTLRPAASDGGEAVYDTPIPEFRLARIDLAAGRSWSAAPRGIPEILLCTQGRARILPAAGEPVELPRGCSAFVAAASGAYTLEGEGSVYRATPGLGHSSASSSSSPPT